MPGTVKGYVAAGLMTALLSGCGAGQTTAGASQSAQAAAPAAQATTVVGGPAPNATGRSRPAFSGTPGAGNQRGGLFADGNLQAMSEALHLTQDQVQVQLRSGKSVEQIAQDQNVPLQQVSDAVLASAKRQYDQSVTSGTMTADQEQQALQTLQTRLPQMLAATPGPRGTPGAGRQRPTPQATP